MLLQRCAERLLSIVCCQAVPLRSKEGVPFATDWKEGNVAKFVNHRFLLLGVLLAIGPMWLGCGGSTGNVAHWQGEVTIDGNPLPAGTQGAITFRPEEKGAKPITVQLNEGKFDSPQVPLGKVKAYFSLNKPTGKRLHSDRTGTDYDELVDIVPRDAQAGIDLEVAGDDSDVKIDL
jgi:hypothetical protein